MSERHQLHSVRLDGQEVAVRLLGHHARPGHRGDRGPVDVGVEQTDGCPALAQRGGQVDRNGRLPDSALARRDGDRLLDAGQDLGRLGAEKRGSDVRGHPHLDSRHSGQFEQQDLEAGLLAQ